MRKKKRGSTAIAVVIIFALIMMVGSSMLTMTLGDYRMRINEGARIKNLYGSDSGLDAAYDIIVKTFDAAAKFGEFKADLFNENNVDENNVDENNKLKFKSYMDKTGIKESEFSSEYLTKVQSIRTQRDNISNCNALKKVKGISSNRIKELNNSIKNSKKIISDCEKRIEELKDLEFKRAFKNFIYSEEVSTIEKENTDKDKPNRLIECIKDLKYVNELTKDDNYVSLKYQNVVLNTKSGEKPYIYIPNDAQDKGIQPGKDGKSYEIKVKSEFYSDTSETSDKNIGENRKVLESMYTMIIPERKDVEFSEQEGKVENIKAIQNRAIIVDKNMSITGSGTNVNGLSVIGDIYVCGTDENKNGITDKAYTKYIGGIDINKSNSDFNGNVITARTLNIKDNVICKISNNLFAKNIYADGKNKNENDKSELKIGSEKQDSNKGQAIIDNDITLNAKNTKIKMNYFYGINDINKADNSENNEKDKLNATSSSIIVNGNVESGVVVNKEAYIMGVANIDTNKSDEDGGYVTGESTGVKGNYIAYAAQTDSDDRFKYYDPLMLLDNDKSVEEKKKHFEKYWNDTSKLNHGGIELPKEGTYASGAIVCKGTNNEAEIIQSKSEDKLNETIRNKKTEYAANVYGLVNKKENSNEPIQGYNATQGVSNVLSELINFEADIPSNYSINNVADNNEKIIFNKENKKIEIKKDSDIPNKCQIISSGDSIEIKTKDGNLNAVIVTKGDLEIGDKASNKGDVSIKGTIMCGGNLNIYGDNTSIEYDKQLVNRIQSDNTEIFNKIIIPDYEEESSSSNTEQNSRKEIKVNYDINKFIKTNGWKIVK